MKEKIEQIRQQALAAIEDAAGIDLSLIHI